MARSSSKPRLSPETLKAIRAHGGEVDGLARKRYGISGAALLGKLVKGESNDNPKAVSSAGARGRTQFIRTTRDAVKKQYGVDPWSGKADDEVKAAVLHLQGKLGHNKGLEGYNPGAAKQYTKYILSQKVGDVHDRSGGKQHVRKTTSSSKSTGGVKGKRVEQDIDGALLDALANRKEGGSVLRAAAARLDSGAYDREVETPAQEASTPTRRSRPGDRDPDQKDADAPTGSVKFAAGADRAGVPTKGHVKQFLADAARYAGSINVGTGTRHSKFSSSGLVSDHWVGNAADIPATGARGDRIAYGVFRAAGLDEKTARRYAKNGGLYNIQWRGKRVQVIWKTNTGGNHYDHVHVGIR